MMLEDQNGKVRPEFEFDLKWTGNSMYGGSLDTVSILSSWDEHILIVHRRLRLFPTFYLE